MNKKIWVSGLNYSTKLKSLYVTSIVLSARDSMQSKTDIITILVRALGLEREDDSNHTHYCNAAEIVEGAQGCRSTWLRGSQTDELQPLATENPKAEKRW